MKNGIVEKMGNKKANKERQVYLGERSTKSNKPKRGRRQEQY